MTDDSYSPLLIFALVNLGIAAALLLLAAGRNRGRGVGRVEILRRLPYRRWILRLSSMLALIAAVSALMIHFRTGHRPGTVDSLPLRDFVLLHPAPFVIIVLGLLAFQLARRIDAA